MLRKQMNTPTWLNSNADTKGIKGSDNWCPRTEDYTSLKLMSSNN